MKRVSEIRLFDKTLLQYLQDNEIIIKNKIGKKIKPKNVGWEVNIKDKQIEKLYIFLLQKSFFLILGNTIR